MKQESRKNRLKGNRKIMKRTENQKKQAEQITGKEDAPNRIEQAGAELSNAELEMAQGGSDDYLVWSLEDDGKLPIEGSQLMDESHDRHIDWKNNSKETDHFLKG